MILKRRLKKYEYYPILREAYGLSDEQCDFLKRVCESDRMLDHENPTSNLDDVRTYEDLKIRFNTKNDDTLRGFGEWLLTGEPPITTDRPRLKFCVERPAGCALAFGIDMFPFWPLDGRCCMCIKRCVARDPSYAKELEAGRALQSMLNIAKRPDVMSPHLSHVLGQIYALDGGPSGFARHVHDHLVAVREKDESSYALGKMYVALLNLTAMATKLDQETVNLDDIDDEGLKKYLQEMLMMKLTKEESVRFIEEAVMETEEIVQTAKQRRMERDAEAQLNSIP